MLPNILKLMTQAVEQQQRVAIRYHGQREIRILEPHAVYTSDRGELVADCYQIKGHSAAGRASPYWRPFRLKKIAAASLLKDKFEIRTREGFSANKARYRNGLISIVQAERPTHTYPIEVLQTMGPNLSERNRLF